MAQHAGYSQISMRPPVLVNFKALSDSQLLHQPGRAKIYIEQGEDKFEHFKYQHPAVKPGGRVTQIPVGPNAKSLVNSSSPVLSFDAIQDYGVLIPPDIQGAVGINYLMETTNQEFDVYSRSGALVNAVSLYNFFSGTGYLGHLFDPHILYDAAHGRYIICCDGTNQDGNGGLFVAVSLTGDPTGNWYVYDFDAAGNDTDFIDYPEMGYNNKWIVLTANNFTTDSTVIAEIYVLRTDSLYAGNLGAVKVFTDTNSYSVVPAQTYDTSQPGVYLVQDANGNDSGSGYMRIGNITGPVGAPVYNQGSNVGVNQPWSENIIKAVQDGGDNTIEDGDTRVMNGVTFSGGSLWFTHNVFLPANAPTHTGVDWWQVDPVGLTVQQFGRVEDPSANTFYYYPSLAVNAKNDMVLGYCISSTTYYPSSAYSFRYATDPANTLQNTYINRYGMASYDKTFGGGRNRWGDFTGTTVDPVDSSFWNFNQYSGITNSWATEIAHIADSSTHCKTHAGFVYTIGLSCGAPFTVSFTNLSTSATHSYWDFGDGTVSNVLNPSHTYAGVGAYSVNLVASDSVCGADSTYKPNIIHISNDDPVTFTNPPVCAGSTTSLSAAGPGAIYWYNSLTSNTPIGYGTYFVTPPVYDTSVFYAQSQIPGPETSCGPVDHNLGPGSYVNTTKQHLVVFDCHYPQKLLSVDVYVADSAYCNIVLLSPNNDILGSVNPFLLPGLNTVQLNFDVPVDHDLKLTTVGQVNMYYNTSGAAYPYYSTDSTLVLIHSDQVTTTDYFYFYNWKIQTACLSNRVPAPVTLINPNTSFVYTNLTDNEVEFEPANNNSSNCHWLFGDGVVSTQINPTHKYVAPGIYLVQLIEQVEQCADTILEPVAVDTAATPAVNEVQSLFIFPDPVNNQLNLQVGVKQGGNWTLLVRDLLGQTLISKDITLNGGVNSLAYDVSLLPAGAFYVSLRNGKTVATRRFIKDN